MDTKSGHGKDFKEEILEKLIELADTNKVNCVETGKRYSYKPTFKPQFFAPYVVTIDNFKIVIFSTTTIRSDRIKLINGMHGA